MIVIMAFIDACTRAYKYQKRHEIHCSELFNMLHYEWSILQVVRKTVNLSLI